MKKMFLILMLIAACVINAYTQTAEEWIKQAEIAEKEGRLTEAGAARSSAGHVQRENGDYATAAENFERAAEHFKADGRDAQADSEHSFAAVSHEQAAEKAANEGRNKEAAKHYEAAAKQWEKMGHSMMAESARDKAKWLPVVHQPRYHIGLIGSLPLGNVTSQNVRVESLQSAMFSTGTMEQLFEQLQGEFFIGSLSGQSAQNFEMHGTTQAMPGLRLGHHLGNRFELRAGGHYFQTKWSGNFPVVVFPFEQDPSKPPQTQQGSLSASSSGILAEADLAYFFTSGTIRPFVHGGIRGQFPTQNESGATLAGVAIPLETTPIGSSYSPFGGAGLRVGFLKNGFVEAGASYGKVPGGGYVPSLEVGVGLRFGTTQNKGNDLDKTIPIGDKNCNICLEDGKCECGDISFELSVTHYSLKVQNDGKKNVREYNVKQPVKTPVKEDSQSGVGKDKIPKDPAEIKPQIPGLKEGDEVEISLKNVTIDCPCTNGTACEAYKAELPNTNEGKASLAKIAKTIAADAALGKANEDVAKIEKELEDAKTNAAKKNAQNKLAKAKAKVTKLEQELEAAKKDLAAGGLGNPNVKMGGKDASGSWDTTTGVFTFDKNGDYGLKVGKEPFVFEFEVSFKCQSFKCDGVTCVRKFKVTL